MHETTIRDAQPEDAARLLTLHAALIADGRGVVRTMEDLPTEATLALRLSGGGIHILAEHRGRIVAEGSVTRLPATLLAHVGVLAMGVHPDSQRRGFGRAILEALVTRAQSTGVIRLELHTRGDNDRAQALYRGAGFEVEGVRKRLVRKADGDFVDDLVMVRFLDCARS